MIGFVNEVSFDNLVLGGAVLIGSFLVMLVLWSGILRTLFAVFGKSRFYFIPRTLKELFFSIAFIFLLLSAALALLFIDRTLLSGEILKILEILLIFAVANIVVRIVLTGLDVQHKKIKDRSGMYRSIGLLKGTVGILLYLFAIVLSINVLSADIGAAVMLTGFFVVILLFAAGFDQIRSVIAGFQLGDYYVDVGHMISIGGEKGFVESVHGRSTLLKTIKGKTIVVPNAHFFTKEFEIDPYEVSELYIFAELEGKNSKKLKERISAITSKIAIDMEDIPKEYKPGVFHSGVKDKKHRFSIAFKITPESDVQKLLDRFSTEFSEEFGNSLVTIGLAK